MYLEQTCYSLTPSDLMIISPEEFHRSVCLDASPYERIGINIKKTVIERLSTQRSRLLSCFEGHPFGENNLVHLSGASLAYYTTLTSNLEKVLHSNLYGDDILADKACDMAGFANYSNFIRSFTKTVGISPGKYKQHAT